MSDALDQSIADNAAGPSEATVDGQTVKQHDLADQIEADRYLASKAAAQRGGLGIRRTRVSPPGANGC